MTIKKTNIHVANIIEEGRWGGPQHRILSIAKLIRESDLKTIVILPKKNNADFVKLLKENNIDFLELNIHKLTRNIPGIISFLFSFPFDIWKLKKAIKKNKIDIVHCNSAGQWKGLIAGRLAGCSTLWHLNDTHMPKSVRIVFKLLSRYVVSGFLLSANRTGTYYLKDKYQHLPQFIIRPPVDCNHFKQLNTPTKITNNSICIISVGNINAYKDTETYIRAADILKKQLGTEVNFKQIGQEFESQKNYIAKIHSLNNQTDEPIVELLGGKKDIRPFLQESDIFVCSSRSEAGPMSVFEAMAMGLPIVSTDVGDIAQMNLEGDFAKIVPVGDHNELAITIAELIKSKEVRNRLGNNARKYALKELDISICANQHLIAYQAILNNQVN